MNLNIVLAVICGAVALVGAFCVVFQIGISNRIPDKAEKAIAKKSMYFLFPA